MATEVNPTDHHPHHQGITMQCPASCLGIHTVGDLVNLLATTARAVLPDAYPSTRPEPDEPEEHDEHTPHCPLSCLNLSTRAANALRCNSTPTRTIGDLVRMTRTGQLPHVRNIGRRTLTEIHTALVAAGIDVQHTNLT